MPYCATRLQASRASAARGCRRRCVQRRQARRRRSPSSMRATLRAPSQRCGPVCRRATPACTRACATSCKLCAPAPAAVAAAMLRVARWTAAAAPMAQGRGAQGLRRGVQVGPVRAVGLSPWMAMGFLVGMSPQYLLSDGLLTNRANTHVREPAVPLE